jgi:hypothetical protein
LFYYNRCTSLSFAQIHLEFGIARDHLGLFEVRIQYRLVSQEGIGDYGQGAICGQVLRCLCQEGFGGGVEGLEPGMEGGFETICWNVSAMSE